MGNVFATSPQLLLCVHVERCLSLNIFLGIVFATSPQVEFPPSQLSRERARTRCLFADVGSEYQEEDDNGDGNDD